MIQLMKKIRLTGIIVCISMILAPSVRAQDSIQYALQLNDVVSLAIEQSADLKYAQNQNVNYYWRYKNFKSQNRPKLVLSGTLPNYVQSNEAVTQPDGSTLFKPIYSLTTNAGLSLNQSIPFTGTYISASTSAIRVQDYNNKTVNFSGRNFPGNWPLIALSFWCFPVTGSNGVAASFA